eukprot:CAMPEP_0174878338 /NCGR_PEP_ID=MMETSP1114-20130205/82706_1 /TAXON_ID=312471 /ORGANISM="Neobodo designis, Strain CCAP 1951/1" /LENGTH=940 /DNA_ID=CAMNT_0016113725 /DNA_START=277 /DNA_END=3099 /DNA_ORIENTATION=-
MCVTCRVNREPHSMHAEFAARHYAAEYPLLDVTTHFIGRYEPGGTTPRGLIRVHVANGSHCDAIVGPGSSGIAVAMNPLVEQVWMDYSATSTELSSRFAYPLFNRVVPTDEAATTGWAPLLKAFDWHTLNVICADTAYGRSVAAGMGAVATSLGGTAGAATCVQVDASPDVAAEEVARIVRSGVRIAVVAMASDDPFFGVIVDAIVSARAYERVAFLFAESACSSTTQTWARVPGAFCATFAVQPAVIGPFLQSYVSRDLSTARAAYSAMGWPVDEVPYTTTGVYPAYATDATRFVLRAMNAFVAAVGDLPGSVEQATTFMRNQTMHGGVSGFIAIPTGDRAASDMVVLNSAADGVSIAVVANTTAAGNVSIAATFTAFGRSDMTAERVPPAVDPIAEAQQGGGIPLVAVIVVVVVLIACIGAAAAYIATRPPAARDNSVAPKNEEEPFTVIFTDIQGSTSQWAQNAEVFGPAVDQHHTLIRRVLERHRGYEVKTIGDAFMVAFESPLDALRCSMAIQEELYAADWPACIDDLYIKKAHEAGITDIQPDDDSYDHNWSGIRVRIGVHTGRGNVKLDPVTQGYDYYGTVVNTAARVHTGRGNVKLDPVTQGYDYYGTVVNTAARVEGVGHGGQILLTDAAYDAVAALPGGKSLLESSDVSVVDLGPQPLRGLAEPVGLVQVLPREFSGRAFPPLRLDVEVAVDDGRSSEDSDGATTSDVSRCSGASQFTSASGDGGPIGKVPRDAPEYACKKAAVRLKSQGVTFESMVFQYHVAKALLSTLPLKDRTKLVFDLADRWRITEAKHLKPKSGAADADREKATDRAVAYLATKAAPVAAAYTSPFVAPPMHRGEAIAGTSGDSSRRPPAMLGNSLTRGSVYHRGTMRRRSHPSALQRSLSPKSTKASPTPYCSSGRKTSDANDDHALAASTEDQPVGAVVTDVE